MRPLALLVALFAPTLATAQGSPLPRGEPPTPGVYNPTLGVAGDSDASGIEKNPAGLGFLRSWSGVYLHSELDGQGTVGGRGDGFFLATPVPLLRPLVVGVGVQLLRPPVTFPFRNEEKSSLAFALRLSPFLSLGVTYAHLWASDGPVAPGVDTVDLAFSARLAKGIAAALVVHDLPSPTIAGLPLQRVWEPELAIRPFRARLLEVAVGARIGERRRDIDPHFRLWLSPLRGLTVKADVEWKRDLDLDGHSEDDVRVGLGLAIDFEHVGVAGFGLFGRDLGQTKGHGFTLAARLSGERYPAIWRGPRHLLRIELDRSLSARALAALLAELRQLAYDRQTVGVVCLIGDLGGSWAAAEELHAELLRLRLFGKKVYAYLADTNTRGYLVASAASRIFLDPGGGINLLGAASSALFFRGLGDKLGIQADFVKIAEYKSAPESFTRSESSPEARAQRQAYVDESFGHFVDAVAKTRHFDPERLRAIVDAGPYDAERALRAGLVDELRGGEEIPAAIALDLGHHFELTRPTTLPARPERWLLPHIATVYIEGDIVDGKSASIPLVGMKLTGMQTLVPLLDELRSDGRVAAVVVRIDSPGGSALAADVIARALERLAAAKPVVCSLGDVAASGGYFIAAACPKIYAAPSTLTGSIGIFSGKFDLSGLLGKLGITEESYERGRHATLHGPFRPYTEEERHHLLDQLRYYYGRFVARVAKGRQLTTAEVDAIGRGHIWSGGAAKERGLVDKLGSFTDALDEAKRLGRLSPLTPALLDSLPTESSPFGELLRLLGLRRDDGGAAGALGLGLFAPLLRGLPASLLVNPATPQARLDFTLEEQ